MKKMTILIISLVAALAVCTALVCRHYQRTRSMPPSNTMADDVRAIDAWQNSIQLGEPTAYTSHASGNEPWQEKLRREEARQRPQEGRN